MGLAMTVDQSPPPAAHPAAPAPSAAGPTGRLRQEGVSGVDRNVALALHLTPLVAFLLFGPLAVFAPVAIWMLRKEASSFVDDHGREVINFCISFVLLHLLLGLTVIGIFLFPLLWIVGLIAIIRGAVAASASEFFRYPMTMRLLS